MVRITANGTHTLDDVLNDLRVLPLSRLFQSLRVVVLRICGSMSESTEQSSIMGQVDAAIKRLRSKGVVVICTARGHVTGSALLLVAAVHYRIADAGACFACDNTDEVAQRLRAELHADDATSFLLEGSVSAARAHVLGFASEVLPDADTRALQFASWIICQSQIGLVQVLGLTLLDEITQERDMQALVERQRLWRAELTRAASQSSLHSRELARSKVVVGLEASMRAAAVRDIIASRSALHEAVVKPPIVDRASRSRHAGIHAFEVYTPRQCVSAGELERAHGCVGKYTGGLLMRELAVCDDDEDVVAMALTAVSRLVGAHSLAEVGCGVH